MKLKVKHRELCIHCSYICVCGTEPCRVYGVQARRVIFRHLAWKECLVWVPLPVTCVAAAGDTSGVIYIIYRNKQGICRSVKMDWRDYICISTEASVKTQFHVHVVGDDLLCIGSFRLFTDNLKHQDVWLKFEKCLKSCISMCFKCNNLSSQDPALLQKVRYMFQKWHE